MAEPGDLVAVLDLERIERDIFRGHSPSIDRSRVFGGLVVAQALVAASRTVAGRTAHSLHAYFLLPGDPALPIVYEVERLRDGRSFATRRCRAVQGGQTIFALSASYQVEERGLDHQTAMPDVPPPEALPDQTEVVAQMGDDAPPGFRLWASFVEGIDIRLCAPLPTGGDQPPQPRRSLWIRTSRRLPDDPALHRAALAYLSDLTLIDVALAAHGHTLFEPQFAVASLDHALWFHRPFRADEWLLYEQDSPSTSAGRGLTRGQLYDRDGRLCASVAQEGLIRVSRP